MNKAVQNWLNKDNQTTEKENTLIEKFVAMTEKELLDLGFKNNPHPHGVEKSWFNFELDNCTVFAKMDGTVTIDNADGGETIKLGDDFNIDRVSNLLKALQS